jgi:purine-cytosine permease-like protein
MPDFLNYTFLNNTVLDYVEFLGTIIICVIFISFIEFFILRRLHKWAQRTENRFDEQIIGSIKKYIILIKHHLKNQEQQT